MFFRAKDKIRELVAKKMPRLTKAKNSKIRPTSPSSYLKTPSRPLNDVLPLEILIEIFKVVDAISSEPSSQLIKSLSLVCRSWRNASHGMELINIALSNPKHMDVLLGRIHARESKRTNIHTLSITADKQRDFYRLPELLTCCRVSLRKLHLARTSLDIPEVELFQDIGVEARPEFYLPNLESLSLIKLTPEELTSLLTIAHPQKLAYLELCHTFLYYNHTLTEELTSLRLRSLKGILIQGYFREETPILTWLCQIAPNLETLELSIERSRLPLLTEFMGSDQILKEFQKIRLWIRIRGEDLDPDSPDLAAWIRVVKERGWKYWVCVSISVGSWVYEG
ncbi:hypothetical protein FRC01_007672 [Tulasnella sp. 417]|nr:hypothetical protein FRC01_007672 [Tulasnella sp. 417]